MPPPSSRGGDDPGGWRGAYAYQPGIEDLFFRIEGRIIELAGADDGGNLQLARSRNDLGHALARMALRTRVLEVPTIAALRTAVLAQARRHLDTLMPGYTHTQPAQPSPLPTIWRACSPSWRTTRQSSCAAYATSTSRRWARPR
jgi:argininosuccinate lyase